MTNNQTQIEKSITKRKAIQYLMRVEEARRWIYKILERILDNDLTDKSNQSSSDIHENLEKLTTEEILEKNIPKKKSKIRIFEEEIQTGEILIDLVNQLCFSVNLDTYPVFKNEVKLFKHIENINFFKEGSYELGLPDFYNFDSSDCFNGKYIPDVVYFIHALGIYSSSKYGFSPIERLKENQVKFREEDIKEKIEEASNLPEFNNLYNSMSDEINQANALNVLTIGIKCLINEKIKIKENELLINLCECKKCKHIKNCNSCECKIEIEKIDYKKHNGIIFLDDNLSETKKWEKNAKLYKCKRCINELKEIKNKICSICSHKEDCSKCKCICSCIEICICDYNKEYNKGIYLTKEEKEKIENNDISIKEILLTEKNTCLCCINDNIIKCIDCNHLSDCLLCTCNCICKDKCNCKYKYDYLKGKRNLINNKEIKCEECFNKINTINSILIKSGMSSFLEKNAFSELIYLRKISIYSIKKFLNIFIENRELINIDSLIETQYIKIDELIRDNYEIETRISNKQISLALLMANYSNSLKTINNIPNIDNIVNISPIDSLEYTNFQKIFYLLQTEPIIICLMLKTKLIKSKEVIKEEIENIIEDFSRNIILPIFNFLETNREEYLIIKLLEFFMLLNETKQSPLGINEKKYFPTYYINENYLLLITNSIIKNYLITCKEYDILKNKFLPAIELLHKYNLLEFRNKNYENINEIKENNFILIKEVSLLILEIFEKNIKLLPNPLKYYLIRCKNPKDFINQFLIPLFSEEFTHSEYLKSFTNFLKYFKNQTNEIMKCLNKLEEEDINSLNIKSNQPSITLSINEANEILNDLKLTIKIYKPIYKFIKEKQIGILETMKSNTFKNNFLNVFPYLLELRNTKDLIINKNKKEDEIIFYLNKIVIISRDFNQLNELKKKLSVLIHIPGKSIEQILLNKYWEEKEGIKKFELIHALFFCKEFNKIYSNINYDLNKSFMDNYINLLNKPIIYKCPNIREFKENLLKELRSLTSLDRKNEYNEFLPIIAADLLNIKFSGSIRKRELNIIENTINNLEIKYSNFINQEISIIKYYKQYCFNIINSKNIKNEYFDKISKFGTYRFKASYLMKKKILLRISDFDIRNNCKPNDGVTVFLSCDIPNEFLIEVSVFDVICGKLLVTLDELLLNKYRGIRVVYLLEADNINSKMGEFDNDLLIELINNNYIR